MIEVGRLVVKIAGRDAGKKGIIIKILDNNYVLLDGEVRRRKVNISHIEPLPQKFNVKEEASHEEIVKLFEKELGIKLPVKEEKSKKSKAQATTSQRSSKAEKE